MRMSQTKGGETAIGIMEATSASVLCVTRKDTPG